MRGNHLAYRLQSEGIWWKLSARILNGTRAVWHKSLHFSCDWVPVESMYPQAQS
jgi:hypothetical protein